MADFLRLAVFSDIHANALALEAVFEDLARQGEIDYYVAAGDLVTDGVQPDATWHMLEEMQCRYVRGNHEEFLLDNFGEALTRLSPETLQNIRVVNTWTLNQFNFDYRDKIKQMPLHWRFSPSKGHDLVIVHSTYEDCFPFVGQDYLSDEELEHKYGKAGAEIVVYGHYHQSNRFQRHGVTYVNVASVSVPLDREKLASYSLFTWRGNRWEIEQRRVCYDHTRFVELTRNSDLPDKNWQLAMLGV